MTFYPDDKQVYKTVNGGIVSSLFNLYIVFTFFTKLQNVAKVTNNPDVDIFTYDGYPDFETLEIEPIYLNAEDVVFYPMISA
jgi:hypothetical protein